MDAVEQLTGERFAPFGHVLRAGSGLTRVIRDGQAVLTRSPAAFAHAPEAPDFALDFYQVRDEGPVLHAVQAERHPNSSQMFVPMSAGRYAVVVWDRDPREGHAPRVFVACRDDVVVYNPGVWHHGIVALGADALFASTMWRTRGGVDAEFVALPQPVAIRFGDAAA